MKIIDIGNIEKEPVILRSNKMMLIPQIPGIRIPMKQDLEDGIVQGEIDEIPTDIEDSYKNGDEMPQEDHEPYPEIGSPPEEPGVFGPPEEGYPPLFAPPNGDTEYPDVGGEYGEIPVEEFPKEEVITLPPEKKFPWKLIAIGAGALALFSILKK